jgi:NDP-sugar pyrophosphorylase family protein
MIPVAILAGGLATRLHPVTLTIPKSLVSVAGEPFIVHQLRLLRREGVDRVVMCVGYLGEMIADFIGDGRKFGLDVVYSFDGGAPRGTGGALRQALSMLGSEFFVLNGDSYLDVTFAPILLAFERSGALSLMTVFRNNGRWDTSNASFDGHFVRYNKRKPLPDMKYIDYGLGILTAKALLEYEEKAQRKEKTAFDLADVYERLAASGQLAGYEALHRFYEIGTFKGCAEADSYLREGTNEHN